jgi:flagellar biogenesis protein FliO
MTFEALALQRTPIISFGYIVQVVFSLVFVLALIVLSAKFLLPRLKTNAAGKLIKVLDRLYLEPQVTAYLLKVGRASWLIVTSSKQVARIDKIEDESLS